MKLVIEISEKEIELLEEAVGLSVKDEDDADYAIHVLINNCM